MYIFGLGDATAASLRTRPTLYAHRRLIFDLPCAARTTLVIITISIVHGLFGHAHVLRLKILLRLVGRASGTQFGTPRSTAVLCSDSLRARPPGRGTEYGEKVLLMRVLKSLGGNRD